MKHIQHAPRRQPKPRASFAFPFGRLIKERRAVRHILLDFAKAYDLQVQEEMTSQLMLSGTINGDTVEIDQQGNNLFLNIEVSLTSSPPSTDGRPPSETDVKRLIEQIETVLRYPTRVNFDMSQQRITYEATAAWVTEEATNLPQLCEDLLAAATAYRQLVTYGVAIIEAHRPHQATGRLRRLFEEMVEAAALATMPLVADLEKWTCGNCFHRFDRYLIEFSDEELHSFTGCRKCERSYPRYNVANVVVVLDQLMGASQADDNSIRISWLSYREQFDFTRVDIVDASDEDVERFVVQYKNDMDKIRTKRHKTMTCTVSPQCTLLPATRRMLERTFASVIDGSA